MRKKFEKNVVEICCVLRSWKENSWFKYDSMRASRSTVQFQTLPHCWFQSDGSFVPDSNFIKRHYLAAKTIFNLTIPMQDIFTTLELIEAAPCLHRSLPSHWKLQNIQDGKVNALLTLKKQGTRRQKRRRYRRIPHHTEEGTISNC